jgi:hypothetical protein
MERPVAKVVGQKYQRRPTTFGEKGVGVVSKILAATVDAARQR